MFKSPSSSRPRRRIGLGTTLAALALVAVPAWLAPQSARAGCEDFDPSDHLSSRIVPNAKLDTKKFHDRIVAAMGDDYMGYVVILKDEKGKTIMRIEYGLARSPCAPEGQKRFTRTTKTLWGSGGSKMTTFVSALHRVEHASGAASPGPKLNLPFRRYLPRKWRNTVHEDFRDVTVGMLTQHRAGFQKSAPKDPATGESVDMWTRLASEPERPAGPGHRSYANSSSTMFQYLPYFWAPAKALNYDKSIEGRRGKAYHEAMEAKGIELYVDYVQDRVFGPLGVSASCHDIDYAGNNWARYYRKPDASGPGHKEPHKAKCAAGGWVMSPAHMAKFVHAFAQTNAVISRGMYSKMTRDNDLRVGWWNRKQAADGPVLAHNGSTSYGAKSNIMHFTGSGFTLVAVTNTKKSPKWNLVDNYNASLKRRLTK
ncbi:MAG: serine hydrolase domain-containing protein [Myxococcota bacterium]